MMRASKRTVDHDVIRRWAEERGGRPAAVKGTASGEDPGLLRITFTELAEDETLESIPWETFFRFFEQNELAFVYREHNLFNKLVKREGAEQQVAAEEQPPEIEPERPPEMARAAVEEQPVSEEPIIAPSATALLREQHREVSALFDLLRDAPVGERRSVFERLADALTAHAQIEESLFYPVVLGATTERELRKAVEEHLLVKRVIADILNLAGEEQQFESKVEVLRELVEHHVAEEESQLFEIVGSVDEEVLRTLGDMMQAAYADLMAGEPRKAIASQVSGAAPLPSP